MQLTKLQRKRLRALRVKKLTGKITMTEIVVPRSGRIVALKHEVLTEDTAHEIAAMPSVYDTIKHGCRSGTIFQMGHDTGLRPAKGKCPSGKWAKRSHSWQKEDA